MNRFVWQEFQSPPKAMLPMARWWWPGLNVTKEELRREIRLLDEAGFAGAEIQAFTRVHRYGTPYHLGLVERLMEEAAGRGSPPAPAWPMGSTRVEPAAEGVQLLVVGAVPVEGGGPRAVPLPSGEGAVDRLLGVEVSSTHVINGIPLQVMDYPRMKRNLKLLRVTMARVTAGPGGGYEKAPASTTLLDSESAKDVTAFVDGDLLRWEFPEGRWQVFAAYTGPSFQHVKSDAKEYPHRESYVVDHFAPDTISPFLDRQIGRIAFGPYAGGVFRALFAYSFELVGPWFWTKGFLAEFRARRGYDLAPYLPALMLPEEDHPVHDHPVACFDFGDSVGERIRCDYERTLADLFVVNFVEEMGRWTRKHGLQSRIQCYGHVMENLRAFGRTDIPETEQLASGGFIDFMKVASSAALLYEKPLVTAESLVWPGRDYMETPMKMKIASDHMTVSGVGQMICHGYSYHPEGGRWPGYFPWHAGHGSFFSEESPLWPWMRQVNTAIGRSQYIVQGGRPLVEVALFCPNLAYDMKHGHAEQEELSTGALYGIDRVDADVPPRPMTAKSPPIPDGPWRRAEAGRWALPSRRQATTIATWARKCCWRRPWRAGCYRRAAAASGR